VSHETRQDQRGRSIGRELLAKKAANPGRTAGEVAWRRRAGHKWSMRSATAPLEGASRMRNLLAARARTRRNGEPEASLPPGFTITTESALFLRQQPVYPPELKAQVARRRCGRAHHRQDVRRRRQPAAVSVRSAHALDAGHDGYGAHLGLNDVTAQALAKSSGDAAFCL